MFKERCQSGRMGHPGKVVCPKGHRGFESLSFRKNKNASLLRSIFVFMRGDEKDGADAERAREAASRGSGNFRATARKLSVTESL